MAGLDITQLKARWAGLLEGFTRGQKTMLLVAVAAAVLGAFAFLRWASEPSWSPLYSGLPAQEAASVAEELDAMGVSYRLEGGDTILVPRDAVYETRLDLSAKGLPADGAPGYALLDDQGITTSDFKQRVDYQRAMEGELARTIRSIEGVEGATVHLVMPEKDLFADDEVRPTASVLVQTRPDASLDSGQVQSIVHLVAASVEGLSASDVTVADGSGQMLAAPGEDGGVLAAGDARSTQTVAFEQRLARSIEELITPVTGAGRVRVRVSADLDFDSRVTTSETFDEPDTSPVVDEVTTNEAYTGAGGAVGGVLGPDTAPAEEGPATDYEKEQTQRSFAVGKVTEQVETAPGQVSRLSVAVLLDAAAGSDAAAVGDLVTAAAGLEPDRGDQLQVTEMDFDESAQPNPALETEPGDDATNPLLPLARTAGTVLIVALVIFFAYRSARRSTIARYPLVLPPLALAEPEAEVVEDDALELDGPGERGLPSREPDHDVARAIVVQSQIGDLIDRQPDEVAQVLRGWLADRRS